MLTYSSFHETVAPESEVGAKAFNLDRLFRAGFAVPAWCAVCAQAFDDHVAGLIHGVDASKISGIIRGMTISSLLKTAITDEMRRCGLLQRPLAVRSSAVGEDSAAASFAGQLNSFLFVPQDGVFDAMKEVWASAFSPHALDYFRRTNKTPESIRVAVVIQEMVDAEVSGVVFSMDPVSGNRRACIVSAVPGLGEGLVSGLLDADVFTVIPRRDTPESFEIVQKIARKTQSVRFNATEGKNTRIEQIPPDMQEKPALNAEQITTVALAARMIAGLFGAHQDTEWAIRDNMLYILQSRPITTLGSTPDRTQLRRIWDNSNIVESYAGVTTPLTFSFVHDVYTEVYQQFCRMMGVEEAVIAANADIFSMLGLIKGRIYYNLLNWYKVLSLMPGYSINAAFMEQMMGVREKLEVPPTVVHSRRNRYLQVVLLAVSLVKNLVTIKGQVRGFYRHLNKTLEGCAPQAIDGKSPQELVDAFRTLEKALLRKWQAPLVNDFYAMIFYGLLKKVISSWQLDKSGTLQNDLLCGEGGIISTEPIMSICAIAAAVSREPALKSKFMEVSDSEIISMLALAGPQIKQSSFPAITARIQKHLERFGDRCVGELKLETVTPRMAPGLLIRIIRSYIKQGTLNPEAMKQREKEVRKAAEEKAAVSLKKKPIKKLLFGIILSQARARVADRENLRFERTRLFAIIRALFCAMGKRLREENVIQNERDIFYLTKQEIFGLVEGCALCCESKKTISLRKEEYAGYVSQTLPDRFETFGAVYAGNTFDRGCPTIPAADHDVLFGTGCCAGTITARVRLVTDPSQPGDLEGRILVAERTDPGWVPFFPLARGLLVERGSLLSHSAIVAREMGIPAVVGVEGLMTRLHDGQMVEMDGTAGTIRIVPENASAV